MPNPTPPTIYAYDYEPVYPELDLSRFKTVIDQKAPLNVKIHAVWVTLGSCAKMYPGEPGHHTAAMGSAHGGHATPMSHSEIEHVCNAKAGILDAITIARIVMTCIKLLKDFGVAA